MSSKRISIIIPVYNGGSTFLYCLSQIKEMVGDLHEIIVVDDCSTDNVTADLMGNNLSVIKLNRQQGPAFARNIGAGRARGELLFFVDADVLLARDALIKIEQLFQQDAELVAAFGSYDDQPSEKNFCSQYKNLFHHYIHQTAERRATTFWSGCGVIKRDWFLALGGFNENYLRPSIEDIELGYRITKGGGKIVLEKDLQCKHLKHWSAINLLKTDLFQRAIPWTILIWQNNGLVNDLNLRYSSRISTAFVYLLVLSLLGIFFSSLVAILSGILAVSLLGINRAVYQFFYRQRGIRFMLMAIFWHWLYYFYSGLAFLVGSLKWFWERPTLVVEEKKIFSVSHKTVTKEIWEEQQ